MSSLIHLAIRRPIGTAMLYISLLVVSLIAYRRLSVDLFPSIDFPALSIVTSYEGVGPEEIETLITRPIEQVVSTIEGVESIESSCSEGSSRVMLRFRWGTDLDAALNDIRAYLDRLVNRLPEDADRPVVYKFDVSMMPITVIGMSGAGDPRRLRTLAQETLAPQLEQVDGVAAVTVRGGRVREIQVELDATNLISHGISAGEVVAALNRENRNVSAGDMLFSGRQVLVRTVGEWNGPEEIEQVVVTTRGGRPIHLRELATVRDTVQRVQGEQLINGQPGITMAVQKESGANTVEVVDAVRQRIHQLNREFEGRMHLTVLRDNASFIRNAVNNVQSSALRGALLAVLVLLFFLRSVRSTLIIATAIPTSIMATFLLMYFAGFTLNVVTFGGLALGVGMLVDSAIVVLENIQRKRDEGEEPIRAAFDGTREVASAIVASTLTTIAIFAPVVFIGGIAGALFGQMAAVVTFSLLCSLLVALTLVPTLAARMPRRSSQKRVGIVWRASGVVQRGFDSVEGGYGSLVQSALRVPWFVIAGAALLLAASLRLVPYVGIEVMPETDEGRIDVDVELAVGTPIETTFPLMHEVERRVRNVLEEGELVNLINNSGSAGRWGSGATHQGSLMVNLVPVVERTRNIEQIMGAIRQALATIPGAEIRVRSGSGNFLSRMMRGGVGERLEVLVKGHDLQAAAELGKRISQTMASVEGVTDVRIDREEGLLERAVLVDTTRSADLGLTRSDIASALETYVLGRVATRLREGGNEFDVRVQLREEDRREVEQLGRLPIMTPTGLAIPLSSVATVARREGPVSISRLNQERVLRVLGGLGERDLGSVTADLNDRLARLDLPEGFTATIGGEQAEQEETFSGMLLGVLLAVFLVYLVMCVLFESLRHPLVIMVTVPFAAIGVVATLILTKTTFNINSFMGLFVLVGIVVNNAIVLIDYTNLMRREHGMPMVTALLLAARRRLRPILMTMFTTSLALVPLAIGLGEGSELQAPLARVVVGGLVSSTLVTLLLIPCVYYLVERRREAQRIRAMTGS
ncbi:MAG: efflux RND transporter permease subunit [Bradymonadales bacterium]|nr:efflux RND transporter permease subunit [Bradymonadales bacterium]